ncbi:MAG: hypothetical protein ABIJ59_00615 [Pseudomonadota bacterium]
MRQRNFLVTTTQKGLKPLAYDSVLVITYYRQIVQNLTANLSDEHANLLAEPMVDHTRGNTDWYSPLQGDVKKIEDCSKEIKNEIKERLDKCLAEIYTYAKKMQLSEDGRQKTLGKFLELAVNYPDDSYIFLVGEHVVLTSWGVVFEGKEPAPPVMILKSLSENQLSLTQDIIRKKDKKAVEQNEEITRSRSLNASKQDSREALVATPIGRKNYFLHVWPFFRWFFLGILLLLLLLICLAWMRGCNGPNSAVLLLEEKKKEVVLRSEVSDLKKQYNQGCENCQEGNPTAVQLAKCGKQQQSGGDGDPITFKYHNPKGYGERLLTYDFQGKKDQIVVKQHGIVIHDTGCVGGDHKELITLDKEGGFFYVTVTPNCTDTKGTQWEFTIDCPK